MEVLTGLSQDFMCRLYVSFCIAGYVSRNVQALRGLPRDIICRLCVSICNGGYIYVYICIGMSREGYRRISFVAYMCRFALEAI